MVGLLEIWRRKGQFALIALIVTLISYLVLMVVASLSGILEPARN